MRQTLMNFVGSSIMHLTKTLPYCYTAHVMHKIPCTEIQPPMPQGLWYGWAVQILVVAWALLHCMTLTQLHAASHLDRLLTKLPTQLPCKMAKWREAHVTECNVRCMTRAGLTTAGYLEGICCS